MKKATVYFTEINKQHGIRKNRSKTIEISDEMFNGYDWSGVEKAFRAAIRPYVFSDSTVRVNRIKLGRATLTA